MVPAPIEGGGGRPVDSVAPEVPLEGDVAKEDGVEAAPEVEIEGGERPPELGLEGIKGSPELGLKGDETAPELERTPRGVDHGR
jgi:hypothetical protein